MVRQTASNGIAQFADGEVLAHGDAGLELHPLGGHLFQAAVDDVLLQLEIGDAVAEQPAHPIVLLEEHHLVAGAGQLLGGGQAGWAGADDGHGCPLRVGRQDGPTQPSWKARSAIWYSMCRIVTGSFVDGQRAGGLAGGRADAAGDLGEVVGRVEVLGRLPPAAVVDQVVELGNAVVHRAAGGVAEGNAAVHATGRLLVEHAGDQRPVDLVPYFRQAQAEMPECCR